MEYQINTIFGTERPESAAQSASWSTFADRPTEIVVCVCDYALLFRTVLLLPASLLCGEHPQEKKCIFILLFYWGGGLREIPQGLVPLQCAHELFVVASM